VLLGVAAGDAEADAAYLARKVAGLRVFEETPGKMHWSVADVAGAVLVVPQFTLLGDTRRGRRPDFSAAAPPETGERLFGDFCRELAACNLPVQRGVFREHMRVGLDNDGPVTLVLNSRETTLPGGDTAHRAPAEKQA